MVEAALFAATGPLTPVDIAGRTGLDEASVRYALKDLRMEYDMRGSAIIISKTGEEYRMMLRPDCVGFTDLFARPEISGGMMRTLSTIAYNQPVLQSKLVRTRGPRAYDDVHRLSDMGLVSAKPCGQSYELTTTNKFAEQFGIGSTRKADIKKWIESMAKGGVPGEDAPEQPEDGKE